jgi:hypothetical protein
MASLRLISFFAYNYVQNHSLPTKFWNKSQQTFEYTFGTTTLRQNKLQRVFLKAIQGLFHSDLLGEL